MKKMPNIGDLVEIKNLLYFPDCWGNYSGYGTILRTYPKVKKVDVSFINMFNKFHKSAIHISQII